MENIENNIITTLNEVTAIQLLKDYIAKTGKSQESVSKELGVSGGLVSAFLKGSYKTPHTIIPNREKGYCQIGSFTIP